MDRNDSPTRFPGPAVGKVILALVALVVVGLFLVNIVDSGADEATEPTADEATEPTAASCERYEVASTERGACLSLEAGYDVDEGGRAFLLAYQSCFAFTPAEVGADFGASSDPESAAAAYASEMFESDAETPAGLGCLAGFRDAGN